jgi:sporulation integral membrane protein YtvI
MHEIMDKFDKLILFFIVYTIIFFVFFSTLNYTLPFVLALVFALILRKPTEFLIRKLKVNSSLASLISTITLFTIITILLSWGVTILMQEAIQLGKNTQLYISKNSTTIYDSLDNFKKYYANLDPNIISTLEKNFSSYITKLSNITVQVTGRIVSTLISLLAAIPYILMVVLFTLLTTYFFTKDMTSCKNKLLNILSDHKTNKISYVFSETKRMLGNYLLSYLLIICLTFLETLIVFLVFKVKYAVMLSIICAVADILPILGIGAIYIPLAIIYFFFIKNYIAAFGIVISYVLVSVIRQIVEPKIVSSSLGIHPVAVLAALFIGLKANGLSGIVFCIFLVVFYNIFKKVDIL